MSMDPPMSSVGPAALSITWHQEVFNRIERWPWLHTLTEGASGLVLPLYDRHRDNVLVELMHGGRWAGHSVHAALSDLPIGFWAAASVLDVLGKDVSADGSRMDPAAALSAAGLLAGVVTVATGVTDWSVSDGGDRRVGLFHGMLNAAGMTLQGASLGARLSGRRTTARALGATSLAVTGAAGYIGGHLVQGKAVMVNRVATTTGPNRWVRAIAESELPQATPTAVDVERRQILLYRLGEAVHAMDDVCSHAGGLLSRGEVADCVVECPLHGSRFDVRDGRIVRGPAHSAQPVLPTRIRNGWIEVRGTPPRPRRTSTPGGSA